MLRVDKFLVRNTHGDPNLPHGYGTNGHQYQWVQGCLHNVCVRFNFIGHVCEGEKRDPRDPTTTPGEPVYPDISL